MLFIDKIFGGEITEHRAVLMLDNMLISTWLGCSKELDYAKFVMGL